MRNSFIDRLKLYKKGNKRVAVIIDYKTNKVSDTYNAEHFKEVYSEQSYQNGINILIAFKLKSWEAALMMLLMIWL